MNKKYILPAAASILMMASCADEFNPEFTYQQPVNLEKIAELADYKPLKEYSHETHPNIKLGAALAANDFGEKLGVYNVAVTNFDEIVAGNAMKYASVVDAKGNMNFSTVNQFVTNAEEAGLTVYGHTLAWHAQQQPKYLSSLIADKPKPVDPSATEEKTVTDYTLDFGSLTGLSWNGCPDGVTIEYGKDDCLVFSNTAPIDPWYAFQYWVVNGISLSTEKEYTITINCRFEGDNDAKVNFKLGDWGGGLEKPGFTIPANGDFADVTIKGTPTMESNGIFLQHADGFVGTVYWKSLTITHKEVSAPSDVEYKEVWTAQNLSLVVRDAESAEDHEAANIPGAGPDGKDAIKIVGKTAVGTPWDTQFFIYTPEKKWEAGEKYKLHMWYKATKAIGTDSQIHSTPGNYIHWQMLNPNPSFTTEWQEKTWEGTIPGEGGGNQQSIAFNLNKNYPGDVTDPVTIVNVDQIDYYFSDITWESCTMVEVPKTEQVEVKKRCIIVETDDMVEHEWDSQFWIQTNEPFHAGDKFEFTAEIRADHEASPGTQIHKGSAGGYIHWAAIGNPMFTTEWNTVTASGTIPNEGDGGDFIAWNLNDYNSANKYYFGSISFKINGKEMLNNTDLKGDDISSFWKKEMRGATINAPISDGYIMETQVSSTIPLTPEEKHDTLVWAMEKWIKGMMLEGTEGKVRAWDVVNEAISGGGDDGEGFYALQHGTEDNVNDFFWQDHMGDLEYVRQAVRLARKYYAEALAAAEKTETEDNKLLLFINDYNLESDWDQNKKVKSLVHWIQKWEDDGVTKIDGIGTQMHISYYEDENVRNSKMKGIQESFRIMKESGKLVRISELDMGYVKADGKDATLAEMTDEMEKQMADYYEWVIKQYFEIIPEAQQYGITQWCLTDAPAGAGWRPNTPVGIWDLNWNRKYVYRGWVNALSK